MRVNAQDTVTGAFEGIVKDSETDAPLTGVSVEIINQQKQVRLRTDTQGHFYQGVLSPAQYLIRVSMPGYSSIEYRQYLPTGPATEVVPPPVQLKPASAQANPGDTAPQGQPPLRKMYLVLTHHSGARRVKAQGASATSGASQGRPPAPERVEAPEFSGGLYSMNVHRGGVFTDRHVSALPLGAKTPATSFDELALLLPGVAPPPQTMDNGSGPGVGPGVGSSGQFAVNGLRSRSNNFTVDGSDNNDEDIGVRRQGFVALTPQTVESVQEYQVMTLLAPAQFGRNIGAQVNAVSKSSGEQVHGALYGTLNSSRLDARNFFDTTNGNAVSPLRAGQNQPVLLNDSPLTVQNQSGGKDSSTQAQMGFAIGGPLTASTKDNPARLFYFISAEEQLSNSAREKSFAVPTVEQRGVMRSGATGIYRAPLSGPENLFAAGDPTSAFPTTPSADAVFSLFPFPNNPNGIYGPNTFTQSLPASGRGTILSGRLDKLFDLRRREQVFTARYNFTNDWRDIPATGGAIFSTLKARVRTNNLSTFLNSEISGPDASRPIFNQLRLSYGRTHLNFEEVRDQTFLLPSTFKDATFGSFGLLNAPTVSNYTLPSAAGLANTGPVTYCSGLNCNASTKPNQDTVESVLRGPVGQVSMAGFSPVGIDVFNFPQRRTNDTYQLADTLTWNNGPHNFAFGLDLRRTELDSELPRNSRPLITINGAPQLTYDPQTKSFAATNRFFNAVDLAAGGAASGFSQSLVLPGESSRLDLHYYQLNFFAQDQWRINPRLSLSYGLRYENNTPPRESGRRLEKAFKSSTLDLVPGIEQFIEGRTRIFDPDVNNFSPRVGLAYSPDIFGRDHVTVVRAGYGLFYDQIPGAVVSQSRNVFPTFLTVNIPGGESNSDFAINFNNLTGRTSRPFPYGLFTLLDPVPEVFPGHIHVEPGTLNTLFNFEGYTNLRDFLLDHIVAANLFVNALGEGGFPFPQASSIGITIPMRKLPTPMAHQFGFTVEQQLSADAIISVAYVGTRGRNLLRFTTPNLGPNFILAPLAFSTRNANPPANVPNCPQSFCLFGFAAPPGFRIANGQLTGGRPVEAVGAVDRFETTASSGYDSLQVQLQGRLSNYFQYRFAYTLAKATDDVSDVFDLAGAPALPQDSLTLAGERGPANFDTRHRLTYYFIYNSPRFENHGRALRLLLSNLEIAGMGQFQTGQPFTVNSIYDVNLDGNLTDRLNTTSGLVTTGDRSQPLLLTADPLALLAAPGQNGSVGRNSFRAGNLLEMDLSVSRFFELTETQRVVLRLDAFNFLNRANFGIPVRFLESPGFGRATDTVTPGRHFKLVLKYLF